VALLPEQLDDLSVPILGMIDFNMGGNPVYHGANFGVELVW
jgi:hypothetical protein